MRFFLFVFLVLASATAIHAQQLPKPPVDTSVFNNWPRVGGAQISSDGKYVAYTISNTAFSRNVSIIVRELRTGREKQVNGSITFAFTPDNKKLVYQQPAGGLLILELSSFAEDTIAGVNDWKLVAAGGTGLLLYKDPRNNSLVINDFSERISSVYEQVIQYEVKEHTLWLQQREGDAVSLYMIELPARTRQRIWTGKGPLNWLGDERGETIVWTAGNNDRLIYCYRQGRDTAVLLADLLQRGIDSNYHLANVGPFSKDGSRLFFTMKKNDPPKWVTPLPVESVHVWSYLDPKLPSQQLSESKYPFLPADAETATYVMNMHDPDSIVCLSREGTVGTDHFSGVDDLFIVWPNQSANPEEKWNRLSAGAYSLVYAADGRQVKLPAGFCPGSISPTGAYIFGTDRAVQHLLSYETATGQLRDLTGQFPFSVKPAYSSQAVQIPLQAEKVGWVKSSDRIVLYSEFDIWMIDLGKRSGAVTCLTQGLGRDQQIRFRLAAPFDPESFGRDGSAVILSAFATGTKQNGFYSLTFHNGPHLAKLSMQDALFYNPVSGSKAKGKEIVKATNAAVWIVRKEDAAVSPNYYRTQDFKSFTPVSDVHPEQAYNWVRSELIKFLTLDKRTEKAVIYQPEDFSPARKYPVIIHYYEERTDELHNYVFPAPMTDFLAISWFVSHGYVVAVPDIHIRSGHAGDIAYQTVEGLANKLVGYPWVDAQKLGLQGHSFAGYMTNYIVTRSHRFAAAMASAGTADLITAYNSVSHGGRYKGVYYEYGQGRMGKTLWQAPELYIDHSPIFRADQINTPILLMNNKEDDAVAFSQGVEMITALRRLGKRAWMLQYEKQNHVIDDATIARLHTIMVTQFFDHYLKAAPAPKWMTRAVPVKTADNWLEPDGAIKTPAAGGLLGP